MDSGFVFVSYSAADAGVGQYLANDLEQQGVAVWRAERDGSHDPIGRAAAVVAVLSPAAESDGNLREQIEQAGRLGIPLHAVRLSDAGLPDLPALHQARSWTDAYGAAAQQNVAMLAGQLHSPAAAGPAAAAWTPPPPAPESWAPPPAQPGGWAPPGQAEAWVPPAAVGHDYQAVPRKGGGPLPIIIALLCVLALGGIGLALWYGGAFGGQSTKGAGMRFGNPNSSGNVTREWLVGTWAPGCPGATRDAVTFNDDGTAVNLTSGASGTWALAGDTMTVNMGGQMQTATWTNLAQDTARVVISGRGTQTVHRCST
jgi:hypothetical protein